MVFSNKKWFALSNPFVKVENKDLSKKFVLYNSFYIVVTLVIGGYIAGVLIQNFFSSPVAKQSILFGCVIASFFYGMYLSFFMRVWQYIKTQRLEDE